MPVVRELNLDRLVLDAGGHKRMEDGCCFMEAASYMAGEPFSPAPQCVCPVIARFGRLVNDHISQASRRSALLRPLIPLVLDTKEGPCAESRRIRMLFDHYALVVPGILTQSLSAGNDRLVQSLKELPSFDLSDEATLNSQIRVYQQRFMDWLPRDIGITDGLPEGHAALRNPLMLRPLQMAISTSVSDWLYLWAANDTIPIDESLDASWSITQALAKISECHSYLLRMVSSLDLQGLIEPSQRAAADLIRRMCEN